MKHLTATVISNQQVLGEFVRRPGTPARDSLGTWLMWLECPDIAAQARPGQFVMVNCGERTLPRPIGVHRAKEKRIALLYTVWDEGKGTIWLSRRREGDSVRLFGPLGNGFSLKPDSRNILLVAGGIGVAPLYFLAERALEAGCRVTLLHGASGEYRSRRERNPPQLYPRSFFPLDMHIKMTPTDRRGTTGLVTELVPLYVRTADQVFACGPTAMYRTMASMPDMKSAPVQVSLEVRMACGTGVCYGCTVKTASGLKQACKDGPVFELMDILWDEPGL